MSGLFDTKLMVEEDRTNREEMLLCFLPTNELFYIIHKLNPGKANSKKYLIGPFLKLAFIHKYGISNALDLTTGEIRKLRENELMVIRAFIKEPIQLKELGKNNR